MKRYAAVVVTTLTVFLGAFIVVEALHVPVLTDPSDVLGRGGVVAAALSVGLLIGDVVLPVPSSGVMISNGALFGATVGAVLSLLGSEGAALVGFAIGRRGGPLLDRLVKPEGRRRADALLDRWGATAVLVTRPVPLLAETVAILAGASPMSWPRAALAAFVGSLPAAVLYALAGAVAASLANAALIFALVIALAAVFWAVARWSERPARPPGWRIG